MRPRATRVSAQVAVARQNAVVASADELSAKSRGSAWSRAYVVTLTGWRLGPSAVPTTRSTGVRANGSTTARTPLRGGSSGRNVACPRSSGAIRPAYCAAARPAALSRGAVDEAAQAVDNYGVLLEMAR